MSGSSHQLAAIMFTDIVGYTAIMGKDEEKALNLLSSNRQIHKKYIAENNGKLLKEMGDGNLVQFNSALDAVNCAYSIQKAAFSALEGKLRIGIHLAEVIIQENDVFGDGVNIASRIQSIAEPGGIFISETVQKAIRNRTDLRMKYLAEINLKNVDYPIKIYTLLGDTLPETSVNKLRQLSGESTGFRRILKSGYTILASAIFSLAVIAFIIWLLSGKEDSFRIAVLPIDDLSQLDEGQYISAGMHSELIDELSKISSFLVISRTSSATYNKKEKSIPEIARELNIDMVIESELFQISDSFRIKVRLIQANPEEKQIWRKEYYQPTKEILAVYGDIAIEISKAVNIELSYQEEATLSSQREIDPQAYQDYLTGMGHLYDFTENSINKALQYFDLSIKRDPNHAPVYMGVSFAWFARRQFGYMSSAQALPEIKKASKKAVSLDSTSVEIHYFLATQYAWLFWDWPEAEREFKRTLELDPDHAKAHAYYAHFLNIIDRNDEANIEMEQAVSLQPYSSTIRSLYGMHLNHSQKYSKAISVLNKTLEEDPNYGMALSTLWTVYHNSGDFKKAAETAQLLYATKGELSVVNIISDNIRTGGYQLAMEKIAEAYIIKKDTTYVTPWQIATLYVRAGNTKKSLYWLEQAFKEKDPNMPYLNADPIFDELRSSERFQEILRKMHF